MNNDQLDFASDDSLTGFRLQSLEVLNWGTFDKNVWKIEPRGRNSLLTGDIGSGKSTLVDAITTLLVPHHRITYNKAAGAETRERSLYSYVRGEYKNEQDEMTQGARAVALRDESHYTVLLATFHNSGFDQKATLAQVFWLKPGERNPERFFVFAEQDLTISRHFSGFGERILDLKKQLRKHPNTQVLDTFNDYEGKFRRYFGIKQKNALELFYQTVSMKSVGRLTDFVRKHMLDEYSAQERIDEMRMAFDNLNRAHDSVLKAKNQIALLEPLSKNGKDLQQILAQIENLTHCRDSLEYWFAEQLVMLTEQKILHLEDEQKRVHARSTKLKNEFDELRLRADKLKQDVDNNGGMLLRSIDERIEKLKLELERRKEKWRSCQSLCEQLELSVPQSLDQYQNIQHLASEILLAQESKLETIAEQKLAFSIQLEKDKQAGEQLQNEIESLRQRRSNIPLSSLKIREALAKELKLDETELAFAGELIQVDEKQANWRGAIERVMHGFALSLLVLERHYQSVSQYVDRTHLRGRIVYYRTGRVSKSTRLVDAGALSRKLLIKNDSEHYGWLEAWLENHFDHVCCENMDDFRHYPRALSVHGQIKTGGRRHEKDDRHNLLDQSRYVLGWDNEDKLAALQTQLDDVTQKIISTGREVTSLNKSIARIQQLRDNCRDLNNIASFDEIDWFSRATEIEQQQQQKREIEESSNQLKSLRTQLRMTEGAIDAKEKRYKSALLETGTIEERLKQANETLLAANSLAAEWPDQWRSLKSAIDDLFASVSGDSPPALPALDKQQREVREHIQNNLNNLGKRHDRRAESITRAMSEFKNTYKLETQEVDASLSALPEYEDMLKKLKVEDLPRHEQRFREMLKEQTTNGLAMFHAQLQRERQEIEARIATINLSLRQIDYNPGTYIALLSDPARDSEISDFQQKLRGITEGALNEDELYTEERFLRVKAIIDRFNGRDEMGELDRRWTRKVTDVRNWFNFSASERWSEDDSEREFYSDSAGKSGGQKEKLAYTILASALAYQFGLEWGSVRSRSFRFVVIDEAFGRGSDESTRYGLELFERLNLQLLIVTPLQKIHIIENHIDAVHFVHNEDGKNSVINNLTLAQYKAGKQDKRTITTEVA